MKTTRQESLFEITTHNIHNDICLHGVEPRSAILPTCSRNQRRFEDSQPAVGLVQHKQGTR